jgi:hypothetical protein
MTDIYGASEQKNCETGKTTRRQKWQHIYYNVHIKFPARGHICNRGISLNYYITTYSSSLCVLIWPITTIIITITHITAVDATKVVTTLKVTCCTAWRGYVIGLDYTCVAL